MYFGGCLKKASKGGISHSPLEYTATEDIVRGTNVLMHTILKIDEE